MYLLHCCVETISTLQNIFSFLPVKPSKICATSRTYTSAIDLKINRLKLKSIIELPWKFQVNSLKNDEVIGMLRDPTRLSLTNDHKTTTKKTHKIWHVWVAITQQPFKIQLTPTHHSIDNCLNFYNLYLGSSTSTFNDVIMTSQSVGKYLKKCYVLRPILRPKSAFELKFDEINTLYDSKLFGLSKDAVQKSIISFHYQDNRTY